MLVIMKFVMIVLILNTFATHIYGYDQDDFSERIADILNCDSSSGERGRCSLFESCKNAQKLASQGRQENICGRTQKNNTIVCCTDLNEFLTPIPEVSSDMRISKQKCIEYISERQLMIAKSMINKGPKIVCVRNNGCREIPHRNKVIIGGKDALPGEFPHMVSLGWQRLDNNEYDWNCGATLINENFALTAAHCFYTRNPIYKTTEPTKYRCDIEIIGYISSLIKHPEYRGVKKYNDIGLVKFRKPIEFSLKMYPACLEIRTDVIKSAIVTGWGFIDNDETRPSKLQKVILDIYDTETCQELYGKPRYIPNGIIESQFCAGNHSGGQDACQGDSGGPIQVYNRDFPKMYDVIGVVSFGGTCGTEKGGIYTKVANYIDWIEENAWPDHN